MARHVVVDEIMIIPSSPEQHFSLQKSVGSWSQFKFQARKRYCARVSRLAEKLETKKSKAAC
jgi:hypothetical protein